MTGRKVRTKKLGIKTLLPVLAESEIDPSEYDALLTENQIATGVEQAEENEYHLQSILKDAGTSNYQEIPVPPPQKSQVSYDDLYPQQWEEPKSYIRSSNTVEEYILGCAYDMTVEDDMFLKKYNDALPSSGRLSEDEFEQIMDVFETRASEQTPFASVDNTIIAYDLMVPHLNHPGCGSVMQHAKAVYGHWSMRRKELGNKVLHPTLKFEMHQEADETDPYVCFRRREARQTRKTRARDVQMTEKLKRLRKELEDGRQLIFDTYEREMLKRDYLDMEREIFEGRSRLKEMKVRLGIKTEDEDLYNHKPPKRKATEGSAASRAPLQLRLPTTARSEAARAVDTDLGLLADKQMEKENELRLEIEKVAHQQKVRLQNTVDLTLNPLSPLREQVEALRFRSARTHYLMTPPASASSDSMDMDDEAEEASPLSTFQFTAGKQGAPATPPAFRRRIGRGGRLWIDRRGLRTRPARADGGQVAGQWKFDQDDDDEAPVYELDPYSARQLHYRTMTAMTHPMPHSLRRQQQPQTQALLEANTATMAWHRAAALGDEDPSARHGRLVSSQHQRHSTYARAALLPTPLHAHNAGRQMTNMAPPLPPAQKA